MQDVPPLHPQQAASAAVLLSVGHMKVKRAYRLVQDVLGMLCMHADPRPLKL